MAALPEALQRDLPALEPFQVTREHTAFNAWISSAGVVAPQHYDTYHNFFVQLKGAKRFLLGPPDSMHRM